MSLRPHVFGFRLAALDALFGSKDQAILERLTAAASAQFADDPNLAREVSTILRRALFDGVPFDDLEDEGAAHVWAAHILAGAGQELWDSGSNVWKVQPPEIFFDEGAQLSPRCEELLELLLGRALFGESIESERTTYAWLTHAEVKELAVELAGEATSTLKNPVIAALIDAFRGWLNELEARGLDLWYLAN